MGIYYLQINTDVSVDDKGNIKYPMTTVMNPDFENAPYDIRVATYLELIMYLKELIGTAHIVDRVK